MGNRQSLQGTMNKYFIEYQQWVIFNLPQCYDDDQKWTRVEEKNNIFHLPIDEQAKYADHVVTSILTKHPEFRNELIETQITTTVDIKPNAAYVGGLALSYEYANDEQKNKLHEKLILLKEKYPLT